jgi:hypothetical protein
MCIDTGLDSDIKKDRKTKKPCGFLFFSFSCGIFFVELCGKEKVKIIEKVRREKEVNGRKNADG